MTKKITEILAPGQELTLREAIDLMAEAYQVAKGQEAKKFDNDAAVQVAEEAFRAGFKAGWEAKDLSTDVDRPWGTPTEPIVCENRAWSDFKPSEDIKELVG